MDNEQIKKEADKFILRCKFKAYETYYADPNQEGVMLS